MSKKFIANIKNIRNAIDTNKLVVFAGAGISIDAGVPGWGTLIDEMKSEIDIPNGEQDYLRIAQMYFNERQQKEYIEKVRTVLKHKKIMYNEIHEAIFKLVPEHILTTNYDDLLEKVIKKESLPFSVVSKDSEFPYALNANLLVKIHGDLNHTDIVLKEDDYIDYSINHPLIEAFIKSVFASKVVLFVGYGFSDLNLKMIIQTVRNILGRDFQNAYLLSIEKNMHPSQREYLKNKGINVVNYYDAQDDSGNNYIDSYLTGNNALNELYFKKGENLSEKGQLLLNTLRFISTFDKFNEPLTEKNVIDQIYLSLKRFSEFKSLPPDFVANLFPFNDSTKYVHNYEAYSLLTTNHRLYDLFFDQITYENDEVKFKSSPEMNLSVHQIKEIEIKLKEIITVLNESLIFHIFKENKKPDSLGNFGWSETSQKLQVKFPEKCNCLICRLSRFQFNSVLKESLTLGVNETTNIHSDIQLGYASYKIGNFHQAVRIFGEAANKAWQAGKYFYYYISKHNIKTLRNLIKLYESNLSKEEKEKILKELEDIDFDKLLFQIPYMGKSEYELLKTIRDDGVLSRAEAQIDKTHKDILHAFEVYKRGGFVIGTYYPQIIEIELLKIITFYTNNYIVSDEFKQFKKVCKKAIEALLISYATISDYKEKLKEFDKLFFDVVIFYCDAKEVQEISEAYQITDLTFNQKDLSEIIDSINNFLASFFESSKFFKGETYSDKLLNNQLTNTFFEEKCKTIFSNIFLILSGVELDIQFANPLSQNLINFLNHESVLRKSEIDYLCAFIHKNYKIFSKEDCISLLKVIIRKPIIYDDTSFLRTISFVFRENKFSGITDRNFISQLLSAIQIKNKHSNAVVYLWDVSDDLIKEELRQILVDNLSSDFDSDVFALAAVKNMLDYNLFFEKYISNLNLTKGSGSYTLVDGKPRLQSFRFLNAVHFIYKMKISGNDERLQGLTDLSEYMKFLINPEEYDYSKFQIEWLYILSGDVFYERLAKIPAFREAFVKGLKSRFDVELAEKYFKYFD
jgi:transcriptional regulator CtsR